MSRISDLSDFYDTDPCQGSAGSDFFGSSLLTFHSLCKVAKKPVTNHAKIKFRKIGVVSPFGWQIESQVFQRCGPAFNKTKTPKHEQQTLLFAKLSCTSCFFLNCLSITNNNNGLLMSKAFTSESNHKSK